MLLEAIRENPHSGVVLTASHPWTGTILTMLNKCLASLCFVPATTLEVRNTSLGKTNQGGGSGWSWSLRLMPLQSSGH